MKILGTEMYSGPEHALYALGIMLIVTLVLWFVLPIPWVFGAAIAVSHYWGREQMNAESKLGKLGQPMFPWQWHEKSQWDFYVPLGVCSVVSILFFLL